MAGTHPVLVLLRIVFLDLDLGAPINVGFLLVTLFSQFLPELWKGSRGNRQCGHSHPATRHTAPATSCKWKRGQGRMWVSWGEGGMGRVCMKNGIGAMAALCSLTLSGEHKFSL